MNGTKSLFWWYDAMYDYADPRIRDFPFMGNSFAIILNSAFYLLLATVILPRFLRNRKPIDLQKYTIYIDVLLLVLNFFFAVLGSYGWFVHYNWFCQPLDTSDSWTAITAVRACYAFLLTKCIYVIHHLPYVLAKKKSPLFNYLLVHHVTFPIVVWSAINFYPGGHVTFCGWMNAVTHVLLFGMKFFMMAFPKVKPWSQQFYLIVHVFQFITCFLHTIQMFWTNDCGVPMPIVYIELFGILFMAFIYYFFVIRQKKSIDNLVQ